MNPKPVNNTPNMRFPCHFIKENAVCAEIGVWQGRFSRGILKKKPQKLHLIDPWIHQDYTHRGYNIGQEKMDDIYNSVCEQFAGEPCVEIHRNLSLEVDFPEEYFDWVYIDGDHNYEIVLKELEFYFPLVKKGGFLCGDDYGWVDADCTRKDGKRLGPKAAVDEFVEKNNLEVEIHNQQFVIHVK